MGPCKFAVIARLKYAQMGGGLQAGKVVIDDQSPVAACYRRLEDLTSMSERRGAQRMDVHLTAQYSSDAVSLSGWVANLSRHGLFLRSEFLDTMGSRARVDVSLPGDEPLHLDGEVVRVVESPGRSGMGIRFRELGTDDRRKLANFMIARSFQSSH